MINYLYCFDIGKVPLELREICIKAWQIYHHLENTNITFGYLSLKEVNNLFYNKRIDKITLGNRAFAPFLKDVGVENLSTFVFNPDTITLGELL